MRFGRQQIPAGDLPASVFAAAAFLDPTREVMGALAAGTKDDLAGGAKGL